jgi:hypothetical protein
LSQVRKNFVIGPTGFLSEGFDVVVAYCRFDVRRGKLPVGTGSDPGIGRVALAVLLQSLEKLVQPGTDKPATRRATESTAGAAGASHAATEEIPEAAAPTISGPSTAQEIAENASQSATGSGFLTSLSRWYGVRRLACAVSFTAEHFRKAAFALIGAIGEEREKRERHLRRSTPAPRLVVAQNVVEQAHGLLPAAGSFRLRRKAEAPGTFRRGGRRVSSGQKAIRRRCDVTDGAECTQLTAPCIVGWDALHTSQSSLLAR